MDTLNKKRILMIAGDFVEDYEIMFSYQALEMVGHQVLVVCPDKKKGDKIKTAIHQGEGDQTVTESPGHAFTLNYSFADVKQEEFDGLVIPGGRCPEYLRLDKRVLDIVRHFVNENKPLAAVCHGIQILLAAGIKGRTVCCQRCVIPEVEPAGAIYKQVADVIEPVVDGNLVTGVNWRSNPRWIAEFLKVLGTEIHSK
jgi:protease I